MCQSLFLNKAVSRTLETLLKLETLGRVFSSEFCKIFKNNFLTEHLRNPASVKRHSDLEFLILAVSFFLKMILLAVFALLEMVIESKELGKNMPIPTLSPDKLCRQRDTSSQ